MLYFARAAATRTPWTTKRINARQVTMAVQLHIRATPFRRLRRHGNPRSARRAWQSVLAIVVLLAFGEQMAFADTAAGLAALQHRNYIQALSELEGPAKAGDAVAQANLAG